MSGSPAVPPHARRQRPSFLILVPSLALLALGCGGDGGTGLPAPGGIDIRVVTSGPEPDPDGYTIALDGTDGGVIGVNASRYYEEIEPGQHTVQLEGLASNCTVAGANPRTVTVAAGESVTVEFLVTCGATTGSLRITTTTSGPSPDPDGYTIALDGTDGGAIGVSETVTLTALAPGPHQVGLSGLAANCTVTGDNPRAVSIVAGAETPVSFAVTCVPQWTTIPLPQGFEASALWASAPTDIFVTGSYNSADERVLHYDGARWTEQYRGGPSRMMGLTGAIWGLSPAEVFAVTGAIGEVLRYNGVSWVNVAPSVGEHYHALWGTSSSDLFLGGSDGDVGLIRHYDGATWSSPHAGFGPDGRVYDLSGASPSDVHALGQVFGDEFIETGVLHYDGSKWTRSFTIRYYPIEQEGYALRGVWANAGNDVFMVGTGGHILHSDGTGWSEMASPSQADLEDVWGRSSSETYAVGKAGVLRYDGTRWTVTNPTAGTRIWGTGTDVFVVTEGGILHGTR